MKQCFLAIDQSTSGTKAIIFSREGKLEHRVDVPHKQYYPRLGWVEHDPEEIYENTLIGIKQVMEAKQITSDDVICLSLSNQRETTLIWDKYTGKPVYPAIVWQCSRAEQLCRNVLEAGYAETVQERSGLVLSPYFSAAKAAWILNEVPGARERAEQGDLLFGTIDSWLIWNLTGKEHITDFSNASRTQLFNITEKDWDDELLHIFGIPRSMMPQVVPCDHRAGRTDAVEWLDVEIAGISGDSHGAFFAQGCTEIGRAKATYGTGSSVMLNVGKKPVMTDGKIVASIGYAIRDEVTYVLEGNINCTGATISWLVDELQLIPNAQSAPKIASTVPDTLGVYLVPAFAGLGAPYWASSAKAVISGLTRGAGKAHVVRAAEESIAYQIRDVIDAMEAQSGISLKELRVDGGPTRDLFLMQFQADMIDAPVERSTMEELSAAGAMYFGGLAMGIWSSPEELASLREIELTYKPKMENSDRESRYAGWQEAVRMVLGC